MSAKHKSVVVIILFFLSLSLLLWLGGWQWRRGVEKATIEKLLDNTANHYTTIDRAPPNWSELAYRYVRLEGDWLVEPVFLMANRIHQGQLGYEVFSPFQLATDRSLLLINRGWVESTVAASQLTTGSLEHVGVSGQLYLPQKGFTLGPTYIAPPRIPANALREWPKTIQYFDAAALSVVLGATLQPAAVALDSHHSAAFTQIWHSHTMRSIQHFGYAVQWWGLAITLVVFGLIWQRATPRSAWRNTSGVA